MIAVLILTTTNQHAFVSISTPLILIHSNLYLIEKPPFKVLTACFNDRTLFILLMPKKSKIEKKNQNCLLYLKKNTRFKHFINWK